MVSHHSTHRGLTAIKQCSVAALRLCVISNSAKLFYRQQRSPATHPKSMGTVLLHLAVDGYGADPNALRDEDLILRFLDAYPDEIGMTKIIPPQVYTYHGKKAEDWGVSGFVLIAESHISVHTFPDRGHVNIDVFSCKPFDVSESLDSVRTTFSLTRTDVWTLDRGLEYSSARQAYSSMVRERVGLVAKASEGDG